MTSSSYHEELENYFISWDEVHRDTEAMAERLKDEGWEQIVALTEGGIGPAAAVARQLNIPMIDTISIRDNACQDNLDVLHEHIDGKRKTLFIDDLVDTGKTARAARQAFPAARFVAIYAKPAGRDCVDDYVTSIENQCWVHFPWDLPKLD